MKRIAIVFFALLCCHILSAQIIGTDVLPVSIQKLDIARSGNKMLLSWKVACFIEQANFEIQRSGDGERYATIHAFSADRSRCGQPFYFEDVNVSGKVFYRVKVGNKDGQFFSSKIVSATGKTTGFNINSFTPTLVRKNALLSISAANNATVSLKVVNTHGLTVLQKVVIPATNSTIDLNLSSLAPGIYILFAQNADGEKKAVRFVKQ